MTFKEEVKDIIDKKPTREERIKEKQGKHAKVELHLFPKKTFYRIVLLVMSMVAAVFLSMMILMDIFPSDLTFLLIALLFGLLIITCLLFASNRRWKRIIGILFACVFMVLFIGASSFMGNTYAMLGKISDSGKSATGPAAKSVNVTEEPFNIYITGIDQWEDEKGLDLERSDVNMIVTVNPLTKKLLLTSIPRDTYVKLHTAQQMDKLTHTGIYGVDETLYTVEDWLGIDLNYYVKMNFTGAKDIIDAMDGINMYSPIEFESSIKGYKYVKGWNKMGGSKSLYYARERKAFEGQDSVRVENQQRVLKAVIKKMTSSTTLLTKYGDIVAAAGDNMSTNMPANDMKALVRMQMTDLSEWDIQTQKIEGEYGEDYVASLSSANKYSIYRPDEQSVEKCMKKIDEVENERPSEDDNVLIRNKSFIVNGVNRVLEKWKEKLGQEDD